jgi:hypothetical protein
MPRRPNQAQINALSNNKREAYYNLTRNNGLPPSAAYNIVTTNIVNRPRLARFRNLMSLNKSDPLAAWNASRAAPDPSNIHNNRALKSAILKSFQIPNHVVNSIIASNNLSNARMNRFFKHAFGNGESWNRAWISSAAGASPTHHRRGHGGSSSFVPTMALFRQKTQG